MGLLHSRAEPGQVHRVVSCRTLKDTLNDIILTSGDAENLENVYLDVWGQRGRRQGGRGSLSEADRRRAWAVG